MYFSLNEESYEWIMPDIFIDPYLLEIRRNHHLHFFTPMLKFYLVNNILVKIFLSKERRDEDEPIRYLFAEKWQETL